MAKVTHSSRAPELNKQRTKAYFGKLITVWNSPSELMDEEKWIIMQEELTEYESECENLSSRAIFKTVVRKWLSGGNKRDVKTRG